MIAKEHARLSASAAHRWILCPASLSLEEQCPEQETGKICVTQGCVAHELAETCLRTGRNANISLKAGGQNESSRVFDEEMIEAVQSYLDDVRRREGTLLVEKKVNFSRWVPDGFGTADAVLLRRGKAEIVDLKFGRAIRLHAEKNPQLMLYALGVLEEYGAAFDLRAFCLSIVQPRRDHVSEWDVSREGLLEWAETILKPAAEMALSPMPPARPGKRQCRFCRAKAVCRALADFSIMTAKRGKAFLFMQEPKADFGILTDEEIAALLPKLGIVEKWMAAFKGFVIDEMEKGRALPGYRLVAGKAVRKWADEKKAARALLARLPVADVFVKKIISPAQAERKLGKGDALIETMAIKPVGRSIIARGASSSSLTECCPP